MTEAFSDAALDAVSRYRTANLFGHGDPQLDGGFSCEVADE
jgi:hypothetical protein